MANSRLTLSSEQKADQQRFADLVEEIIQQVQAGEPVDVEQYAQGCPEHAEELRQFFPAMRVLADLASSLSEDKSGVPLTSGAQSVTGSLGDYRIVREIGRGGMGVVYEAEQLSLGRRVALKVLPFAAMLDPRHLQRFQNEARAAASLKHPNIVGIHAVGCERGVHYYAMEYIDGRTLAQVIEELKQLAGAAPGQSRPQAVSQTTETVLSAGLAGSGRKPGGDEPTIDLPSAAPDPQTLNPEPRTLNPEPPPLALDTKREPQAAVDTKTSVRPSEFFRTAASWGIQAAEALEHAHQMGIVHRDIKPSNLMVDLTLPSPARGKGTELPLPSPAGGRGAGGEGPHLWVTDFGLAHVETGTALTMTGDVFGTLRYMSPEQSLGKASFVDQRTDIYSLGVTLYELLTLQPAFAGEDRQSVLRQIAEEEPPPPRRHNRAIPKDLETIMLKAMSKEPQSRYPTAQDLADDLRRFLEDQPIRAKRPSLVQRGAKFCRRHKGVTFTAAACILVVAVLAGALKLRHDRQLWESEQLVRESLTAARTAIEVKDYALAREKLAAAETALSALRGRLGSLAGQLEQLRKQVQVRIEAAEKFQRFLGLTDQNRYRLTVGGVPDAIPKAQQALSLYGVLDHPTWNEELERRGLEPEQVTEVREIVYEVLVLLADSRIRWWNNPDAGYKGSQQVAAHESLRYLEQAAAFHEATPGLYWVRSKCYNALGDTEAAAADAKRAKESPGSVGFDYFVLGRDARWANNDEEALRWYRAGLRVQPDHHPSFLFMGLSLGTLKRHEEAATAFSGYIALRSHDPLGYHNRAFAHVSLGRLEEALADYTKIIELAPKVPRSWIARGTCYHELGQLDKALKDLTKAVDLGPDTYPRYYLALYHLATGDTGAWRKACAAMLEEYRRSEDAQTGHWVVWSCALGPDAAADLSPAIALAEKAVQGDPKSSQFRTTLGAILYRARRFDEAIRELQEADRLWARSPLLSVTRRAYTWYFLALAHYRLERKNEARVWLDKAMQPTEEVLRRSEEEGTAGISWDNPATFKLLRAEAEELLGVTADSPKGAKVNSQGRQPLDGEEPDEGEP